jgi:hypothetical protein
MRWDRLSGVFAALGIGFVPGIALALPCADYASLLDAQVPRAVVQRILLESPPEDGWSCLEKRGHNVAVIGMARAFAALDSTESLRWNVRFKQCEASVGIRRGAQRLLSDKETEREEEEVGPETVACRQATALQEAILADARAEP